MDSDVTCHAACDKRVPPNPRTTNKPPERLIRLVQIFFWRSYCISLAYTHCRWFTVTTRSSPL